MAMSNITGSMNEQNLAPAPAIPTNLKENKKVKRISRFYLLASFGSWMALITPIAVTMALRVQEIDPVNKAASLGLVLGAGAFFPVVTGPIVGLLSDRTTSRFGMRRPWMFAGALGGFLGLLIAATATTIPLLLLGWCLTQFMFSVAGAATQAIIPDQIPESSRGKLSGLVGMSQQFALIFGIGFAQVVNGNLFLAFMIPAVIGLLTMLTLAIILPDRRLARSEQASLDLIGFIKSFWISPRKYPDFGWAFVSRFLMSMGLSVYANYSVYYLTDHLGFKAEEIPGLLLISLLVTMTMTIGVAVWGGILSDRLGRRKIFVIGAALVYTLGMVIVGFASSFVIYLVGGALGAAAIGLYTAVDLALVTQVLPDKGANAAKDMGVFNIANVLPQSLAPALAPLFLLIGGPNNYAALYLVAALFGILGAVTVQPIKSVR